MEEDTFEGQKEVQEFPAVSEQRFLKMKEGLEEVGKRLGLEIMEEDVLYKSGNRDPKQNRWSETEVRGILNGKEFAMLKTETFLGACFESSLCLNFGEKRTDDEGNECVVNCRTLEAKINEGV